MQPFQWVGNAQTRRIPLRATALFLLLLSAPHLFAQAALLLEQPFGVFGALNPTGHAALYLERVCADSPIHLRPCEPGEYGVVISRYKGMGGYDWGAIPLIPYLYAVDDPSQVPTRVNEDTVNQLRNHYREARLGAFGAHLPPGGFFNGGWTELVGTAYDRRTYAFRFATTPEQDRELIARLNVQPNQSHFNILYNNCADFDRFLLNNYFPHQFGRTVFPDAGITTPKHITYTLVKYSKRHPEAQLTVLEIPQVPGYRHQSRSIHGVTETLITNGYVIPVVVLNPYIAGGLLVDYLVRGRYPLIPKNPAMVDAGHIEALAQPATPIASPILTGFGAQQDNPIDPANAMGITLNGEPSAAAQSLQMTATSSENNQP
jgi:hypothetical protein